jgi:hypothetical protein
MKYHDFGYDSKPKRQKTFADAARYHERGVIHRVKTVYKPLIDGRVKGVKKRF